LVTRDVRNHSGKNPMKEFDPTMAQQVAQAIAVNCGRREINESTHSVLRSTPR
jgi:hypothetical protein